MLVVAALLALVFEFINGFHDTANAVATSIATRALNPSRAIALASVMNLLGALWGGAVALTVARGIVDSGAVDVSVLLAALVAACCWNLLTWWKGLPTSSSHALLGALCGAALAHAGISAVHWYHGVYAKILVPMLLSPLIGFLISYTLGFCSRRLEAKDAIWQRQYQRLQLCSASAMAFMHGSNDAQKTMGILCLLLLLVPLDPQTPTWLAAQVAQISAGEVPVGIKVICALVMAAGTAVGGWRIIRTLGFKVVQLNPRQGVIAESSSALVIAVCSGLGVPVSTTHNISASVMGSGGSLAAIRWSKVRAILWAWVLTFPLCCGAAAVGYWLFF